MCRGKGDYHRLGHGSDDHVRRPRQVQGLQGKKVIAIATGSLHCVCCTEDGRWEARPCNLEAFDLRGRLRDSMRSSKVEGGWGESYYILRIRLWFWPSSSSAPGVNTGEHVVLWLTEQA